MVAKSYHATVSRLSSFCSDPNFALHIALSRFLGNLRLTGRDPADIIAEIALICFFPRKQLPTSLYPTNAQPTPSIHHSPLPPYSDNPNVSS